MREVSSALLTFYLISIFRQTSLKPLKHFATTYMQANGIDCINQGNTKLNHFSKFPYLPKKSKTQLQVVKHKL